MKYDLIVRYAGQERIFTDVEMDDEVLVDESYNPEGREANLERLIDHFFMNVSFDLGERNE